MSEIPEVAYAFLYIAPGLVLVQALRLGGIGRRLRPLDKLSLCILLAVALRWAGPRIADSFALQFEAGLDFEFALLILALALGLIVALLKRAYDFLFGFGRDEDEQEEEPPPEPRAAMPVEPQDQKTEQTAEG
jgi:hypothetical protein